MSKVRIKLNDEETKLFLSSRFGESFTFNGETYQVADEGHCVFRDSKGVLWLFDYDDYSFEDYPINGKLLGPVEVKTREVTYYE